MVENIFEFASRHRLRFSYKGSIATEDLWNLSLTELDSIFKTLNKQFKTSQEESLLETKTEENKVLEVKIAIVKYIVAAKQKEAEEKLQAEERKKRKQKIMEVMEARNVKKLEEMSDEELAKELASLEDKK